MNKNDWIIEFVVNEDNISFLYDSVFTAKHSNGLLEVSVKYDYSDVPLLLSAECVEGDKAKLINRTFRLELYVNDILWDEEWPYGNHYISSAMLTELNARSLTEADAPPDVPTTISFNPHGWKPSRRIFVGDCMPFTDGNTFHVFYLRDRRNHNSKWKKGGHQWAHIKTDDLINWYECPLALKIENMEEGSFCTGSVVKHNGVYYAYYAVRTMDGSPARLGYATSSDADVFIKSSDFFTLASPYNSVNARDPKAFINDRGEINLLITTSLMNGDIGRGCLARVVSKDAKEWRTVRPFALLDIEDEPECSDYFEYNGFYYLVYSNYGTGHYFYSKNPEGPWSTPEANVIMDESLRVPKAAVWKNRLFFVGFISEGGYGGKMHFCEAKQAKNGTLEFIDVPEML